MAPHPRAVSIVFFIAGAAWLTLRAGIILKEVLPEGFEGRDLVVDGFVADIPTPGDYGLRFEFDVADAAMDGSPVAIPGRILLSDADPGFEPRVGERWRMTVRLKRPHGFRNPGGFDCEAHLFRKRIRARGYVRGFRRRSGWRSRTKPATRSDGYARISGSGCVRSFGTMSTPA